MAMTVEEIGRRSGALIPYTNSTSAALAVGTVVEIGTWGIGVVVGAAIPVGGVGTLRIAGEARMDAASGAVTFGAAVYYDSTNENLSTTASGNTACGIALEAKATATETLRILLNGLVG